MPFDIHLFIKRIYGERVESAVKSTALNVYYSHAVFRAYWDSMLSPVARQGYIPRWP